MLYLFIIALYFLLAAYFSKSIYFRLIKLAVLGLLILIIFTAREQLALVLLIFSGFIFIDKKLKIKNKSLYFILFSSLILGVIVLIGTVVSSLGAVSYDIDRSGQSLTVLYRSFKYICSDGFQDFIWKFPLYFLGLGFLDPTTVKTFGLLGLVVRRLLALDSLIIQPIFIFLMLLRRIQEKNILGATLLTYFIYYSLYFYAESNFRGIYGFGFRQMMPFIYLFALLIITNIKKTTPLQSPKIRLYI